MWKRTNTRKLLFLALAVALTQCSDSKFRGNSSKGSEPQTTPPPKTISKIDKCKDKTEVVGVDLAFVIDNSGSNVYTDCPNSSFVGKHTTGNSRYQCGAATNRETAVGDAYDALMSLTKGDVNSDSKIAITSFPGDQDIYNGSEIRTQGWVAASSNAKNQMAQAMAFTRSPIGMTPYGAGLNAAAGLFDRLEGSNKPKLLILVTDGEPTDSNPGLVSDQVQDRLKGVKIVTVMVSPQQTRASRKAEHAQYLKNTLHYNQGTIDKLIGSNAEEGLAGKISDKIIEIPASGQLKNTFMDIISENISCK